MLKVPAKRLPMIMTFNRLTDNFSLSRFIDPGF